MTAPAFPYDASLVAIAGGEMRAFDDALGALAGIDRTCRDGDGLKWFTRVYREVTAVVRDRVASGSFSDSRWMGTLGSRFAALYFRAVAAALAGKDTADSWEVLFTRRADTRLTRIQFAFAGMNAHINHDLPSAIVTTCELTGTGPSREGSHYRDYTSLNAALETLVDEAKRILNVRLLGDALPPLSSVEHSLAGWSVTAAREAAWVNAEVLWALRDLPLVGEELAAQHMQTLDGTVAALGKAMMVPL